MGRTTTPAPHPRQTTGVRHSQGLLAPYQANEKEVKIRVVSNEAVATKTFSNTLEESALEATGCFWKTIALKELAAHVLRLIFGNVS